MKYYAGIGSRRLPPSMCSELTAIAARLEQLGYVLRSGGARGADSAFASGVKDPSRRCVFKADVELPREAFALAEEHHPAWRNVKGFARRLHARNSLIILGEDLATPVEFVVCWTSDAACVGGTGQGLRVAKAYGITVYNLADPTSSELLQTEFANLPRAC